MLAAVCVLVAALAAGAVYANAATPKAATSPAAAPSPSPTRPALAYGACPTPTTLSPGARAAKVVGGCPQPCPALNVRMPATMAGLAVTREDPCSEFRSASGKLALDAVALYGLRQPDKLLMATLEIGHFVVAAPAGDPSFRSAILDRIGDSQPQSLLVGRSTVYVSVSPSLVLVSWFRQRYLFILVLRDSYTLPKTLLRAALGIQP